jgi:hypothetical protein
LKRDEEPKVKLRIEETRNEVIRFKLMMLGEV